mmetsp:Transcript_4641/g.13048  ORF Transcript_4641/g.13048 Transcript_4641/m.13048 type:complete len:218 (-) Transcript_4641:175-828(-)
MPSPRGEETSGTPSERSASGAPVRYCPSMQRGTARPIAAVEARAESLLPRPFDSRYGGCTARPTSSRSRGSRIRRRDGTNCSSRLTSRTTRRRNPSWDRSDSFRRRVRSTNRSARRGPRRPRLSLDRTTGAKSGCRARPDLRSAILRENRPYRRRGIWSPGAWDGPNTARLTEVFWRRCLPPSRGRRRRASRSSRRGIAPTMTCPRPRPWPCPCTGR